MPALAQQVIADGDQQYPAAGSYHTTDPVLPGDLAGHVFVAINGGQIRPAGPVHLSSEGRNAHAVHAEGAGSHIALEGGSILTTGAGAAGLSVAAGASLHATGLSVHTQGNGAPGVRVDSGSAQLDAVSILSNSHGIALNDGELQMRGGSITLNGSAGQALTASAGRSVLTDVRVDLGSSGDGVLGKDGARIDITGGHITGGGYSSMGVAAENGAAITLSGTRIELQGGGTALLARRGDASLVGGNLHVELQGDGRIGEVHGADLELRDSTLRAKMGVWLGEQGRARLERVDLSTEHGAVELQGDGSELVIHQSRLESRAASTVWMPRNGRLSMQESVVVAYADGQGAVDVRAGHAHLADSEIQSHGRGAHGVVAQGGSGRPVVEMVGTSVHTRGDGAAAAAAWLGGAVTLERGVLLTTGRSAHAVMSGGSGAVALSNTHVRAEGEGAYAAVINDGGRLTIDGGSLVSAQHGGVWVRSTRDPGLTLGNGAVVSGGNGIALALDAAVAGRFDVALEGGAQLLGDIVTTPEDVDAGLLPQSQVHVRLADASLWQGASDRVQTVVLDGGSQWTLTGDATVGELQVRDSALVLSDGSGRFNTLTVDGDLHSEGATFLFNGALGDDSSAMDRLHVRGNTSGDAQIAVRNIGGVGAETVDGIRLIEVDGASLARYTLAGRAVGGAYEYFLFQGGLANPGDGAWYLRSQWFDHCAEDPFAAGCSGGPGPGPDPGDGGGEGEDGGTDDPIQPPPVLRPEAGAYLANQSAAVNMFDHRLHERVGAVSMQEGRTAWARVGRSAADFTAVGGQLSVDGSTSVLQMGGDVLRQGNAAFGVMLGSGRTDSRVASDLTGYTANGRVRGTAVGVYGTWMQDAEGTHGAYMDAILQHGRFDNRVQGIGLERETYDSRTISTSLEGGYTFTVWQGAMGQLYLQPQVQVSYTDYRADRHVEQNGTVVDRADAGGLNGRVGVRVFGHGMAAGNRMQPYLGVNWLRASGTRTVQFNGDSVGADVPRNRYEVQTGAELKLGQRWGAWAGLSVQHGDYGYRNLSGQAGMRMAW